MFLSLLTVMTVSLMTGCKKDEVLVSKQFGARVEAPASDTKTYLVNERWVYWDMGDALSVSGDADGGTVHEAAIISGDGTIKGYFRADGLNGSDTKYLFIYPHSASNTISYSSSFNAAVKFPAVQDFRDDYTFGKDACPMVGYSASGDSVLFHSLAGMARIQLFSSLGTSQQITKIELTEMSDTPKQISGMFTIRDYDKYDPYLIGTGVTDESKKITINCDPGRTIGGGSGNLCTFYLTLPALNGTTTYKLGVKVTNAAGKQCTKVLGVKVRRNSIMKVPALDITEWQDAPDGTGTTAISFVGNGTETRPFQIYTADELARLRDTLNAGRPVNGQPVTASTYFAIMRSDIVLTTSNWTSGIKNFTGRMYYAATSSSTTPGITNNSNYPIFASISSNGVVEDITIKGDHSRNVVTAYKGSPLCGLNNGVMRNCRTATDANFSVTTTAAGTTLSGLAGICDSNAGTIEGCVNQAHISCPGRTAAGICLYNLPSGKVVGCYAISTADYSAAEAGAVVYNNQGLVRACYFGGGITSSTASLGGVVFHNHGQVHNCMLTTGVAISTTGSLGGIAYVNWSDGEIDSCQNSATRLSANDTVGGIVAVMRGGEVRNSYCGRAASTVAASAAGMAGGVVGYCHAGRVRNCFSRVKTEGNDYGGFVGVMDGGECANCYARFGMVSAGGYFYGRNTGGTLQGCYNYKVAQTDVTDFTDPAATIGTHDNLTDAMNDGIVDYLSSSSLYRPWVDGGGGWAVFGAAARSHRR